ncbi:MAG: carboxypeptidase-like regulatory domain-containing protein [Acidobacteriota bacterium]
MGGIEGSVTNSKGLPISGARVSAFPQDRNPTGRLKSTLTDDFGRFVIDGLRPGAYLLFSSKESENYVDTMKFSPGGGSKLAPKITVGPREVTRGVEIRREHKATAIRGRVLNGETGTPITSATIKVSSDGDAKRFFSSAVALPEGRLDLLLEPGEAVRIEIHAQGYQTWSYGKDGSPETSEALYLAPEMTKDLIVRLRPLK